ncbi:MAG: protein tyrosine phosphatase family protein [Anaerolineae bacterium]|jgi:uncharacterized protein (TIGR01244 family)
MQTVEDILNFLSISERLGTAGQPTPAQFAAIRAAGYEAVINLAMPDSTNALADEGEWVEAQGMRYVHIPVVWESPTLDDLGRFFDEMDACQGKKVFVHCAMNMRVSCFVLLYRVLRRGVPLEDAVQAVDRIWAPNATWQAFVDRALAHYGHERTAGEI